MAPPDALHTVEVDIYTARRQRVHQVNDATGKAVFHDKHILEVLDWLAERDIHDARFTDDTTTFVVTFARVEAKTPSELETENG